MLRPTISDASMVSDKVTISSVLITFRHFCDLYAPKRIVNSTLNKYATINATNMYGMMILTIFSFFYVSFYVPASKEVSNIVISSINVQVTFAVEQATKAQRGSRGIALRHAPAALPPGNNNNNIIIGFIVPLGT